MRAHHRPAFYWPYAAGRLCLDGGRVALVQFPDLPPAAVCGFGSMLGIAGYQAVEIAIQRRIKKGKAMAVIKTHPKRRGIPGHAGVSEGTATHPLTKKQRVRRHCHWLRWQAGDFYRLSRSPVCGGARRRSSIVAGKKSTASGRLPAALSVLATLQKAARFADFSPISQDRLAIQLIRERGALEDLQQGRIERAISRCRNIWASLPGPGTVSASTALDRLVAVWRKAGGVST
ncbi:phage lysin [Klebsiella pneumoniae subsp. pneumoniae]|uniref:Phage lysin n=1 Tax=Klebsiella pneumoniae subsp. pneumoniae TaxID=72407 RepID=A0A377Z2Q5_KLEPN|nr:phage lysin [Klebsiella pneumoniae subsp. pneumoniae]